MDPQLFRVFVKEFTREFNRLRGAEGNRIEQAKSELAGIERRLKKIVDAIADGVPARTLKEELSRLEASQDELRERLASSEPDGPSLNCTGARLRPYIKPWRTPRLAKRQWS
jgi:hypothetical protein